MKILILGASVVFLTGCGALDRFIAKPVVTEVPGQFVTNLTITPLPGGLWQTNYNISLLTRTNWVKNDVTFDTAESVAGVIPGYGPIVVALLGMFGTAYTAWLNKRNKKAHIATIEGVEQFRDGLNQAGEIGKKLDAELKHSLVSAHSAAGVSPIVKTLVDENTVPRADKPIAEVKKVLGGHHEANS